MQESRIVSESEAVPETGTSQLNRQTKLRDKLSKKFNVAQGGRDLEAAPVASGVCHDESEAAPVASGVCHDEADIPDEEDLPVASFKDDVQRKLALRKVMPHKDDEEKPAPEKKKVVQSVIVGEGGPGSGRRPEGGRKDEGPPASIRQKAGSMQPPRSSQDDARDDEKALRGFSPADQKMIQNLSARNGLPIARVAQIVSMNDKAMSKSPAWKAQIGKGERTRSSEAYDAADLPGDEPSDNPDVIDGDNNDPNAPADGNKLTKEQVNYRYAEDPKKCCETCSMFSQDGSCSLITGPVRDVDVCDKWESKDGDDTDPGVRVDPTDKLRDTRRSPVPSEAVEVDDSSLDAMLDAFLEGTSSSWGMSTEGGPGSGRRPEGKAMPITPGKRLGPSAVMRVSKKDVRDMTIHSRDAIRNKSMCGSKRTDIAGIVVGRPGSPDYADKVNKINCPGCLGKIATRHFRATEEGGPGSGRRPSDAHSAIAASLGVTYDGIQKGAISRGGKRLTPDLALFTDPAHGSTLAIPATFATPNWIATKVAMARQEFGRATQKTRQRMKDTARHESEVSPPGAEHIVKALKKDPKIDNPWAVAWSMQQEREYSRDQAGRFGSGGGAPKGLKAPATKVTDPQAPGKPSQADVAKYWSKNKDHGHLTAPKFTGQGKIGVSHLNKMNVMSKDQGRAIFSKAGKAKGMPSGQKKGPTKAFWLAEAYLV